MNVNRYRITVDNASFQEFYWGSDRVGLTLSSLPRNASDEDIVIIDIVNHETGEDKTVEIITEYSNWYGAQGTRG